MTARAPETAAGRYFFHASAILLGVALLLGGGGSGAPLHALVVQLLAVGLLALTAMQRGWAVTAPTRLALALLALILLTPLLQLVPFPHAFWSALPGRELLVRADRLLGSGEGWRPLTLNPELTWLSVAYLLPPAAMFLATLRLVPEQRRRLGLLVVAMALLSLALGVAQTASGGGALHLYSGSHNAFPTGLFVNRNHQADLLLIGMIFATALLPRAGRSPAAWWGLWLATVAVFAAGVIATTSRMGFLLLPVAIIGSLAIKAPALWRRGAALWAGVASLAVLALIATSAGTDRLLARFEGFSDVRLDFWADAAFAARQYFPWGSGLGTFDLVYRSIENLDRLNAPYVNHAHNDYLELLIETGLWGSAVILLFLLSFGWLAFRRADPAAQPLRRAAAFSILIMLIHSLVDYPLRMIGLLTLFGFLCALLLPPAGKVFRDGKAV